MESEAFGVGKYLGRKSNAFAIRYFVTCSYGSVNGSLRTLQRGFAKICFARQFLLLR